MKRWTESNTFRAFLGNFGKHLPLRKASAFADRDMVQLVLSRSDGITGRATRLDSRAAAEAMIDGTEFVTVERVEKLSQREAVAA